MFVALCGDGVWAGVYYACHDRIYYVQGGAVAARAVAAQAPPLLGDLTPAGTP